MKTKKLNDLSYNCCLILLIAEIAVFLLLNILWEHESFFFIYHEAINHARMAFIIDYSPAVLFKINASSYPLLIPYLAHLLLSFVHDIKWCLFSVQSFFVVLNVMATYFLCAKLTKVNSISFWSASALLWLPASVASCRTFTLDYPLAAELTLWCLCYVCSKQMSKVWPVISFCIVFFIMLLTKYSFIIYIIPCILAMLVNLRGNKKGIINFIAVMAFLCSAGYLLFCHFTAVSKIDAYTDNIWSSNYDFNFPFFKIFSVISLILRGVIVEYKIKILTIVVFWIFAGGFITICLCPKLRRKYMLVVLPCLASVPIMLFSANDLRYHYPVLSFSCIIAGIFLNKKDILRIISLLFVIVQGIMISGGWMLVTPPSVSSTLSICSNLQLDSFMGINPAKFKVEQNFDGSRQVVFETDNILGNLFNLKSCYSEHIFYTYMPYKLDLYQNFSFVFNLPENSRIKIECVNLSPSTLDLSASSSQIAYLLDFLSIAGGHNLHISENMSEPDYILQYYSYKYKPNRLLQRKEFIELDDAIKTRYKLTESKLVSNLMMYLYKRE